MFCNYSRNKDGAFVKAPNLEKAKLIYAEIKEWAMVCTKHSLLQAISLPVNPFII